LIVYHQENATVPSGR